MQLYLTNSLSQKTELFTPINANNVCMYVCGPTVYSRAHIGNIRSAVVYDILYRLLLMLYPKVTYVRNITDVDDKIIAASKVLKIPMSELTHAMTKCYHDDLSSLNCLSPTYEPKATECMEDIIILIEMLISKGYAYVSDGHVLFDVNKYKNYGKLSNRSIDDMIAGARIEVATYKRNAMDFVLWKPTKQGEEECSFPSKWSNGRPGWHIECSVMSTKYLGKNFDIHGGGVDLIFPHHENELAQSCCAYENSFFAKYWVHNGFLTMHGEKMSKSLGNFKTLEDIFANNISPEVLRYFYLTTHYRKPIDYNDKVIYDAQKTINKFAQVFKNNADILCYYDENYINWINYIKINNTFIQILCEDLNTPAAISYLHKCLNEYNLSKNVEKIKELYCCCKFLGLNIKFKNNINPENVNNEKDINYIKATELAVKRSLAKHQKNWVLADKLRGDISMLGYAVKDIKNSANTSNDRINIDDKDTNDFEIIPLKRPISDIY